METIEMGGILGRSTIRIGERLKHLSKYVGGKNIIVISDDNVWHLYGREFPACPVIRIGTGEAIKNLETVGTILSRLVALGADRSTFLVGIGGGIVCDITGFVASIYMRGLDFGFVATTLLSQVDASIGGKNGVNLTGYKNMIGVFNPPSFVICDMNLLNTLPKDEIRCGFAEIVKHAAIADAGMFAFLENEYRRASALDSDIIKTLIYRSVSIKADIVGRDEQETGERRKLNFGHTFGHAVEKTMGVPHGVAVAFGMVLASDLSVKEGLLNPDAAQRIKALLVALDLPTRLRVNWKAGLTALTKDKKKEGDFIRFVLLRDIGQAVIREIAIKDLEAWVA